MLDTPELRQLADWCEAHAIRCRLAEQSGKKAVLLEPRGRSHNWRPVFLTQRESHFTLFTESGDLLAQASDLNSVLDALRAGVGEQVG